MNDRNSASVADEACLEPNRAPVFIIGSGRSGTTLLRMMLNAHPNIFLTNEASFYVGSEFVPWRASTSDWLETYFRSVFFYWLNIEADQIREELAAFHAPPVSRAHIAEAYRAIMRTCAKKHHKIRYGDKTPLHSRYLGQIFQDFPDARVIQIVRDPRAVICSLSKMPWAPRSIYLNCVYYQKQLQTAERYDGRILKIRLEDLLDSPKTTLGTVLDFIGEPWDDRVLDYSRYVGDGDMPPFPWQLGATQPIRKGRDEWQHSLGPVWIDFIQRKFEKTLIRYGYQAVVVAPKPSILETLRTVISEIPEAITFGTRFFRLIRQLSGRYPADPKKIEGLLFTLDIRSLKSFPETYAQIVDNGASSALHQRTPFIRRR